MIYFIKTLFVKIGRKKTSYVTFLLLPILTTLLALSLSFSGNSQAKIGILDKDHSQISKQFIAQLKQNKKYDIFTKIEEDHIDDYFQAKTLEAVLTIDKGFSEKVLKGETQNLKLRSIANSEITEWFKAQVNYLLENYNLMGDVANGDQKTFDKILQKNKGLDYQVTKETLADRSRSKSVSSTTTGFLLILMLGSTSVIYGGILADKSSQIYNRLVLSKLSRFQYMLSYVCLGLVAFTIQIIIMLSLLRVFNISFYIPLSMLVLIFFLFSLLAIGFALLIGAVTQNSQQSSQMANLIVMPTSMLAGCLWPLSITPSYMQTIGKLLPQNWVLSAIATFQSGGGLSQAWPYLMALLVTATIFMTLSSLLLKPSQS
ncbi:ABC transporter permease [Streptococcus pseudoporcinus]|uniref:ABC-2 type transporter n=1 Tax=Streptococcus pseudoporcinus LQ 940-04 TaxID=875093 RepID=G5KAB5_9STRE|nr:ABC transporter permease [Streptococcus pseudoporcinus]EFR43580.1 ABC-2 type transporter [Streptococcus pseudoporcinus SPIN 20026]EHI64253.1 ABC-2 type transporter [Streptococcus pseudoporcinus LQ 940-04]VEF93637.1 transport permease yfiM [Streptococcus pseudoporcinus]